MLLLLSFRLPLLVSWWKLDRQTVAHTDGHKQSRT